MEFLIKRHDAFESLLAKQNTKLENLQESGKRLIDQQHFDAPAISDRVRNVTQRRQNVKDLSDERHRKLADSLLYAQFNRDCLEAEGWIEDKIKVATEEQFSTATDLYDKMRKLQKHQAFEAEIMANAPQIKSIKEVGSISGDFVHLHVHLRVHVNINVHVLHAIINANKMSNALENVSQPYSYHCVPQKGEELIQRRHEDSVQIQKRVNSLIQKWNDLIQASTERGKGLEEAKDILKFNEEVDKVQAWIRDKEMLVSAGDMGRDYEHCLELQKKVNDVEGVSHSVVRVVRVTFVTSMQNLNT